MSSPAVPLPDRSARRAALLEAADRVVRRDGQATSMAAVAAEAGVSKPILYRHFGDKAGLTAALAERHTERLLVVLRTALAGRSSREARVERTISAYLQAIEEDPHTYRFLLRPEDAAGPPDPVRGFTRGLVELLADGIAAELGTGRGVRELAWAHAIVGMVESTGDWWLDARPCSRQELAGHLTALLRGAYAS